jgi:hypothetical protein
MQRQRFPACRYFWSVADRDTIKWDSRGEQAILHNDMAQVERVPKKR